MDERALEVNRFWFGELDGDGEVDEAISKRWWGGGPELDREIRHRFHDLVVAAGIGALDDWQATPRGTLALILVLDQLPRNMFRGLAEQYFRDPKAQAVCLAALERGVDAALTMHERAFLYMPLMHAEDRQLQQRAVALFEALARDFPATAFNADFARRHARVVDRFGRFPHRNDILERTSTGSELEFLQSPEAPF